LLRLVAHMRCSYWCSYFLGAGSGALHLHLIGAQWRMWWVAWVPNIALICVDDAPQDPSLCIFIWLSPSGACGKFLEFQILLWLAVQIQNQMEIQIQIQIHSNSIFILKLKFTFKSHLKSNQIHILIKIQIHIQMQIQIDSEKLELDNWYLLILCSNNSVFVAILMIYVKNNIS
jgi:hypothetical protein